MAAATPMPGFPPPPVLTPGGIQLWWVVPEGAIGLTIGEITSLFEHGTLGTGSPGSTGLTALFTVKEATTKPSGAVAGPFSTQAEAQAAADQANGRITATTQPTPSNIASGLIDWSPLFQSNIWLRAGEIIVGIVLLAIGVNALFKGRPLQVVTNTAAKAAMVVPK